MAQRKLPLALYWLLLLVVLAIFLPLTLATTLRERGARLALELDPLFTQPSFDLSFPKTTAYDPLSFVGRGRKVGYWDWSPQGLSLTEKGRRFFTDSPSSISGSIVAGRRAVRSITSVQDRKGGRQVQFIYVWRDISEPAALLLNDPPHRENQYEGVAFLSQDGNVWRVKSLDTPDWDKPLARLLGEVKSAQQ